MNALVVLDGAYPSCINGISIHTQNLIDYLSQLCTITVLTFEQTNAGRCMQIEKTIHNGIVTLKVFYSCETPSALPKTYINGWRKCFYAITQNWMIIKDFVINSNFDVIHFQDYFCSSLLDLLKNDNINIPIVTTIHAVSNNPLHFKETLREHCVKNSDCIVAVSEWERNEIASNYKVPDEMIFNVHNGVSLEGTPESIAHKKIGIPSKYISFAGRLVKYKGCDILLNAAATLGGDFFESNDLRLLIMGDGPEKESLVSLSKELGIKDFCYFTGEINPEEVRKNMRQAALHVVPSFLEPFGMVATEALSVGTKIVVAYAGGLPEICKDSQMAFLFKAGSSRELAEIIAREIKCPPTYAEIVREIIRLENNFSWKKVAEETYKIYLSAIENQKRNEVIAIPI